MSGSDDTFLRCTHCKGFYETSFPRCKWCEYDAPVSTDAGQRRVFPSRDACRALQIAEYDRLPAEALADPMGPPKDELTLLCNCLHCGPDGHTFEAIEMRWMTTERMWACPCTTCGGRGFGIDVHSAENKWQCADCGHFYLPANRDTRHDMPKCPKCGSTCANGWFADPEEDDDDDACFDDDDDDEASARQLSVDEDPPWDDDEDGDADDEDHSPYDLGITWKEDETPDNFYTGPDHGGIDDALPRAGRDRLPDDIDFPRHREDRPTDLNDDDIPF